MIDLEAIEARANAATVGPHTWESVGTVWIYKNGAENFISHVLKDIPALIARVRELEKKPTIQYCEWEKTINWRELVIWTQGCNGVCSLDNPGTYCEDCGRKIKEIVVWQK